MLFTYSVIKGPVECNIHVKILFKVNVAMANFGLRFGAVD